MIIHVIDISQLGLTQLPSESGLTGSTRKQACDRGLWSASRWRITSRFPSRGCVSVNPLQPFTKTRSCDGEAVKWRECTGRRNMYVPTQTEASLSTMPAHVRPKLTRGMQQ